MTLHIAAACELLGCKAHRRGAGSSAWVRAAVLAAVGLVSLIGVPTVHATQADDGWIGKRVVTRYSGFHLKIGSRAINPKVLSTYRVEQVNGPWLWLKPEGDTQSGWVPADQVVPLDEAKAFFTDCIRSNPADRFAYAMRAIIRSDVTHEFESALADYNEAIRLRRRDPQAIAIEVSFGPTIRTSTRRLPIKQGHPA